MTLLVVDTLTDTLYVDSYTQNAIVRGSCVKWLRPVCGRGFSAAGSIPEAYAIMERVEHAITMRARTFPFNSRSDTVVVFRYESRWWVAAEVEEGRYFMQPAQELDDGVPAFGYGWSAFRLFFAEHGDVALAAVLAAKHSPNVNGPVHRLDVDGEIMDSLYT